MNTVGWSWWSNINNPEMRTLPLRRGIREIMKSRAFLGDKFHHVSIILNSSLSQKMVKSCDEQLG